MNSETVYTMYDGKLHCNGFIELALMLQSFMLRCKIISDVFKLQENISSITLRADIYKNVSPSIVTTCQLNI